MALLHIKSTNKNLSYVLVKNPANPLTTKSFKNGMLFGFYPKQNGEVNLNEYCIYFKDSMNEQSYKNHPSEEYSYMSANNFNDCRFLNDAISELLLSAREMKGTEEYDFICDNEITVFCMNTKERSMVTFQKFFKDVKISYEEISRNNFKITFSSTSTLSYILKVCTVFSLFATMDSSIFLYVEEHLIRKYLKLMNDINTPYFIKYIFKINCLRSPKLFQQFNDMLNENSKEIYNFEFGDTHEMRINAIKKELFIESNDELTPKYKNSILDIGTGYDFRYLRFIAPIFEKSDNLKYYCVEKDEDAYSRIKHRIATAGWSSFVSVYKSLEEFIDSYKSNEKLDIICTEVLEHNEIENAKDIVRNCINTFNFNKFIITVPNKDFNKYYGFNDADIRHDDHKWEPTSQEIFDFFIDIDTNKHTVTDITTCGDTITSAGIVNSPTHFALIKTH